MSRRFRRPDMAMSTALAHPHVHETRAAVDQCARCDARSLSVCNAIPDGYLGRLAAAAVVLEIPHGTTFIGEGEPATAFFNITRGTAKLFKLLPDGRRQITGFARAGHFLGLAVSDTFAFSAEAIEASTPLPFPACPAARFAG